SPRPGGELRCGRRAPPRARRVAPPGRRRRRRDAHHGRRPPGRVPAARGAEAGAGSQLVRRLAAWLAALSARERTLVAAAATAAALALVARGALAVRDDLATLGARVAGHERELAAVRPAAAGPPPRPPAATGSAADPPALLARLEAAATDAGGRERIASMTPTAGPGED